MNESRAAQFDDWLRDRLHEKRWNVMDLARAIADGEGIIPEERDKRARAISSNISNARLGKGSLGDEYARKIAAALDWDEVDVFRAAGLLSSKPKSTESEASRKIRQLVDMLSPEEQRQAIEFLDEFRRKREAEAKAARERKLKRS